MAALVAVAEAVVAAAATVAVAEVVAAAEAELVVATVAVAAEAEVAVAVAATAAEAEGVVAMVVAAEEAVAVVVAGAVLALEVLRMAAVCTPIKLATVSSLPRLAPPCVTTRSSPVTSFAAFLRRAPCR